MVRVLLAACLLSGCSAGTAVGASTVTAMALGASALNRSAGGCYAVCTNGTVCNRATGWCERMPCDGRCAPDEHCETSYNASYCAPGAAADIASKSPASSGGTKVPVMQQPPPPASGGPPQPVPAAEQGAPGSSRQQP